MRKILMFMSAIVVAGLFSGGTAAGQDKSESKSKPIVPLKVQIVISRWDGEKKISSLPYTLVVNANDDLPRGGASLRTGARVPVPSIAPPKESPIQGAMGPVTYQSIGTNIDCSVQTRDDGRFEINIRIDDTSVYVDGKTAPGVAKIPDIPSFRTFQSSNAVILRDGQSSEFTVAADKVSGEITKVDVTVTVVK